MIRSEFTPAYLACYTSGELHRRVECAIQALTDCTLCPRDCHIDRRADRFAVCKTGRYATVSSFFPHFGEEDCLRGSRGSGTIFFVRLVRITQSAHRFKSPAYNRKVESPYVRSSTCGGGPS